METQLLLKKEKGVRTRFAPSPTGFFHIGSARTALFNYLWAKKNQGTFILRIEDTDRERYKKEFEEDILESLKWLGIIWDEGPIQKKDEEQTTNSYVGEYGPYRQSERKEIYKKYIKKLYNEGFLYWCFCTKEELEAQKQDQAARGETPRYKGRCRNLSQSEIEQFKKEGKRGVLRFKTPNKILKIKDLIRGEIVFDTSILGDFVVAKDFETPLYNLACVIDDAEMRVNYIIRGEDHISNTPKQILIQEALGFPRPKYAHIPLILSKERTKISKREGGLTIKELKEEGYLPEAIINFIALLGWNPDTEEEFFTMEELIEKFSIEKIQKSPATFNKERLDFVNGYYIRNLPVEDIAERTIPFFQKSGILKKIKNGAISKIQINETKEVVDISYLIKVVSLFQERVKKLSEFPLMADFFFKKELPYKKELLLWKNFSFSDIQKSLKICYNLLEKLSENDWYKEKIQEVLFKEAEKTEERGLIFWPFRVALSGKEASPPPFDIAEVLGKEKTLKRIDLAIKKIGDTK